MRGTVSLIPSVLLRIILIFANWLYPLHLCFNLLLPDLLVSCVCFHTFMCYFSFFLYELPTISLACFESSLCILEVIPSAAINVANTFFLSSLSLNFLTFTLDMTKYALTFSALVYSHFNLFPFLLYLGLSYALHPHYIIINLGF